MLDTFLDLVVPLVCHGCGTRGSAVCGACRAVLAARPLGRVRPSPCPEGLPEVHALGRYDGVLRRLLLAHKERGVLRLTAPLGSALAATALDLVRGPVVLCPVPSTRSTVRARGHDHAGRLAAAAAEALRHAGAEAAAGRVLVASRRVADQSGLSTAQRAANLRGALRSRAAPTVPVLLVDDVMTTGATLVEAARALRQGGHDVRGAVVLGATRRRFSSDRTEPLHRSDEGV